MEQTGLVLLLCRSSKSSIFGAEAIETYLFKIRSADALAVHVASALEGLILLHIDRNIFEYTCNADKIPVSHDML